MHVLIHSYFYDPEPLPKPHDLAIGLMEKGHEVSVITSIPSYPVGSFYPGYHLRPWQWEIKDGIRVLRLPLFPDHSGSGLRRMLSYTSFMASSSLVGPFATGKADVMYVWHPPLTIGLSAWLIGMKRRIPFMYGVHDLWPEAVVATGMMRSQRLLNWLGSVERFVYRQASVIGVVSPGYKRNLEGKGVPQDKVHVLTDWADQSVYRPVPPDPVLSKEMGMAGRFNVLFGGNMGMAQALGTVVEAAERLVDYPEIQFVFVGDGVEQPRLEAMVKERNLTNVRFLGRHPNTRMPDLYALSEVLLAHYKKDPLFEISIPGKLFAYLACQKPVLMASGGDAADIVDSAGAGITCPAEHPDAMAQAVLKLYKASPQERAAMGAAGLRVLEEQYSRRIQIDRHEELLTQICRASNRSAAACSYEAKQ